jgi:hypothetical protein
MSFMATSSLSRACGAARKLRTMVATVLGRSEACRGNRFTPMPVSQSAGGRLAMPDAPLRQVETGLPGQGMRTF